MRHALTLSAVLLAACSSADDAPTPPPEVVAQAERIAQRGVATPTPTPAAVPIPVAVVTPGRAPPPTLRPVGDVAVRGLAGELRCGFAGPDGGPLFVAAADADRSDRAAGVIDHGGGPAALGAVAAGGFDALTRGGEFAGQRLSLTLARGAAVGEQGEGSRHAAVLTLTMDGRQPLIVDGTWTCGP